jgi:maltose/moltooligosaccharide transporter
LLAALALVAMPAATSLLPAALLLWMLDASINVAMEPFRAFVGDSLRRSACGRVCGTDGLHRRRGGRGSIFPYVLAHFGVSNVAATGAIPDTVRISFHVGAAAPVLAVLATVVGTREYSPAEMAAFGEAEVPVAARSRRARLARLAWLAGWGGAVMAAVPVLHFQKEVYLLGALLAGYGVLSGLAVALARSGRGGGMLASIVGDFSGMPPLMKRLAVVQFFSWSAMFIMWIYTTPVVAQRFFGATDPASAAYQDGSNWVGVLFTCYNGFAALFSLFLLPRLAAAFGPARTHALCLLAGAVGFAGFLVLRDPRALILGEVGIGIGWAGILAMPYAILASSLPQAKLGVFMGLFNVFIVVPQLLVATVMGSVLKTCFPTQPV